MSIPRTQADELVEHAQSIHELVHEIVHRENWSTGQHVTWSETKLNLTHLAGIARDLAALAETAKANW